MSVKAPILRLALLCLALARPSFARIYNYSVTPSDSRIVYYPDNPSIYSAWSTIVGNPNATSPMSGNCRTSEITGAQATLRFNGSAIYFYTTGGPTYGECSIALDGQAVAVLGPNSSVPTGSMTLLWSQSGLALDVSHQIEIVNENPGTQDTIAVNGFVVTTDDSATNVASVSYSLPSEYPSYTPHGGAGAGGDGLSSGQIAGISIGAVIALGFMLHGAWLLKRRAERRRRDDEELMAAERPKEDEEPEPCIGLSYSRTTCGGGIQTMGQIDQPVVRRPTLDLLDSSSGTVVSSDLPISPIAPASAAATIHPFAIAGPSSRLQPVATDQRRSSVPWIQTPIEKPGDAGFVSLRRPSDKLGLEDEPVDEEAPPSYTR